MKIGVLRKMRFLIMKIFDAGALQYKLDEPELNVNER